MNHFLSKCLIATALLASAATVAEAKTITLTPGTGVMSNPNGRESTFKGMWTSNATDPQIILNVVHNNMLGVGDDFEIYPGTGTTDAQGNGVCTITLSTPTPGWQITGFSFNVRSSQYNDGKTLTYNDNQNKITLTLDDQAVSVSGLSTASTSMTYVGANTGATFSNVTVTVEEAKIVTPGENSKTAKIIFDRRNTSNDRRIPAITTVEAGPKAGRIVAVYDNRPCNGDIGAGNIGLEISYSDNNGETWSTPDYGRTSTNAYATKWNENYTVPSKISLSTMQANSNKYWDCAFGDAAIVSDRETGKILLMAVGGPMNFFSGRRSNPNSSVRWYSEDGGTTWTMPTNMTEHILSLFDGEGEFGYIDSQFIGSGRMMQSRYVKVGKYYRVYAVLSSQFSGNNTRNWCIYTDDFGESWHVLGGTDRAPVNYDGDEPKAEELPDGSVLLAARNKSGNRNFNIFRYTDIEAGKGHWDKHITTDMGFGTINACDGEIMILPVVDNETNEQCYLALQSFPYGGSRSNVSIAYKPLKKAADIATPGAFRTWESRFRVSSKGSAYSTMTWQHDNTLGFFYEEQLTGSASYDGVYFNFTIEEITNNAYSYQADENDKKAKELRDELASRRAEQFNAPDSGNGYVGEYDPDAFDNAFQAYMENPSVDTYVALNKAEYDASVIEVVDGATYQFISAHEGSYKGIQNGIDMSKEIYLTHDGSQLNVSDDPESTASLFTVKKSENGNWQLYSINAEKYIGQTTTIGQNISLSSTPADYILESNTDGHTTISCADPGNNTYNAIYLNASARVVVNTASSAGSRWYMKRAAAPETDAIRDVEVAAPAESDEIYFDINGRQIEKPSNGLFITNQGRKVILNANN